MISQKRLLEITHLCEQCNSEDDFDEYLQDLEEDYIKSHCMYCAPGNEGKLHYPRLTSEERQYVHKYFKSFEDEQKMLAEAEKIEDPVARDNFIEFEQYGYDLSRDPHARII